MFSPFQASKLHGFKVEDIEWLHTSGVAEGMFVEYKSKVVDSRKIANSIASFANSYGGWYIVGIEADSKDNRPTAVTGISLTENRDPLSTIREAVKEYLDPTPVFYPELVILETGSAVAVICIPDRQNKPIVSKDGRIYRRIADASDPVFEKDRGIIDRLVEEGKAYDKRFDEFCTDDRTHCQGESKQPWLHVYIQPYPDWAEPQLPYAESDLEALLKTLNETLEMPIWEDISLTGSIRFNSVRSTANSMIISSVAGERHDYNHLVMELFSTGWARLRVPLQSCSLHLLAKDADSVETDDAREIIQTLANRDQVLHIGFIGAGNAVEVLLPMLAAYKKWLGDIPSGTSFNFRIGYDNMWRNAPFVDCQEWADFVSKCGFQVSLRDDFAHPPKYSHPLRVDADGKLSFMMAVATQALMGLGLPPSLAVHALAKYFPEDEYRSLS